MKRAWRNLLDSEKATERSLAIPCGAQIANVRALLEQACANLSLEALFTGDPSHSFACSCPSQFPKTFPTTFSMELRGKCDREPSSAEGLGTTRPNCTEACRKFLTFQVPPKISQALLRFLSWLSAPTSVEEFMFLLHK